MLNYLQVDRKLVKQTVMTSVYGVTYIGARDQIKRRLQERGVINDEPELFAAACYAARVIAFKICFLELIVKLLLESRKLTIFLWILCAGHIDCLG